MKDVCDRCGKPYDEHYEVQAAQERGDYYTRKESVTIAICPNAIYERVYREEGENRESTLNDSEKRIVGHVIDALKKGLGGS